MIQSSGARTPPMAAPPVASSSKSSSPTASPCMAAEQVDAAATPCAAAAADSSQRADSHHTRGSMVLSASAMPWYPPRNTRDGSHATTADVVLCGSEISGSEPRFPVREESVRSQPFCADEFPCEPTYQAQGQGRGRAASIASSAALHASSRLSGRGSPMNGSPLPYDYDGVDTRGSIRRSGRSMHRSSSTPHSMNGDDDADDVIIMRFRDDEAQDEEALIRRLAEGAFWSTDAPAAEGLHHLRHEWEYQGGGDPQGMEDDDFNDWEDDSAAYEDSLDSEQLDWLEAEMRARDNPENFFF